MPLAQIVSGQLTEDSTNSIVWRICLNPGMTFQVKVVEDWVFDERLSQFGKGYPSSGCEKTRLRLFRLRRISTFFPNLNLAAINLNVIHPTFIKSNSITSSSAATTYPDYILPGFCWLGTQGLQHRGKWCSYPTESLDKSPVKVGKSEEDLDVLHWLGFKPSLDCLDSFVLHANALWGQFIAKEPNLFLMESTLLQVSI